MGLLISKSPAKFRLIFTEIAEEVYPEVQTRIT